MKKVFAVLFIMALIIGMFALIVNAMKVPEPAYYERYVVQKGDTL